MGCGLCVVRYGKRRGGEGGRWLGDWGIWIRICSVRIMLCSSFYIGSLELLSV